MPNRVRRADAADIDAACAVLTDAFADYAWTRWTVDGRDHEQRIESLQRLIIEHVALPYGEVWVGEDERGHVACAAIWMLPASPVPVSVWDEIATAQAALEGDRHEMSVRAEAAIAALKPIASHYYLGAVGTRPDCQRRGFATDVLSPVLERAAADGLPAYLETSSEANLRFYAALGFAISAEVQIPDGGPHVWAMSRPATFNGA